MNNATSSLITFAACMVCATATVAGAANGQQTPRGTIFTHEDLETAWRAAVTRQQPLLVMFSTEGCHYCDKMLTQTYNHPAVTRLLAKNTESVLVHSRDYPDLVGRLGIRGYPTSLLVAPNGNVLEVIEGFADAKTFLRRIAPRLIKSAHANNTIPSHATVAARSVVK